MAHWWGLSVRVCLSVGKDLWILFPGDEIYPTEAGLGQRKRNIYYPLASFISLPRLFSVHFLPCCQLYRSHFFSAFDKWPRHNSGNNISSPYTFMMNLQIIAVEVWSVFAHFWDCVAFQWWLEKQIQWKASLDIPRRKRWWLICWSRHFWWNCGNLAKLRSQNNQS